MSKHISETLRVLDGARDWKAFGGEEATAVQEGLPDFLAAKGFPQTAIQGLAAEGTLGSALDKLFLGNHRIGTAGYTDYFNPDDMIRSTYLNIMVAHSYSRHQARGRYEDSSLAERVYAGGAIEHGQIRQATSLAALEHAAGYNSSAQRQFRRNGASGSFAMPGINLDEAYRSEQLTAVPIAVVGCGASGILLTSLLYDMGFKNVTVFDKRGRTNGLWTQKNVNEGTKNNPFRIQFGRHSTGAAIDRRSIEGSGQDIDQFLGDIAYIAKIKPRKATVTSIQPGDLRHRITFEEAGETKIETYPIVIYAPGIGEPLDPNDESRMSTPMQKGEAGSRWQKQFTSDDFARLGNRVVCIGLGNSTAEIIHQLHQKAPDIDYRILTHRPLSSMLDPTHNIDGLGTIYRNTNLPELTKLAGDLPHIDRLFQRARKLGKIVTSVRHWHHDGSTLTAIHSNGIKTRIPFSKLFTLIGYGQNPKTNRAMGLTTYDERTGSISYDFDGEVQCGDFDTDLQLPRRRIYPGYFALGPLLKNRHNPNAIVIPGIQYQLQFLAFTLLVRAAEVAYSNSRLSTAKTIGTAAL